MSPSPARIRSTIANVVVQPDDLRELRRFHKTLADVNRLRICRVLADRPATVTELIEAVGLSQPLVSWHLGKLREVGPRHGAPPRPRDRPHHRPRGVRPVRRPAGAGPQPRRPGAGRAGGLVSGSLVSPETRARVRGLMTPIAVGLGRLGLTPNGLTLIGFGIAIIAAGFAVAQLWLPAGPPVRVRRGVRPVRRRARPRDQQGQPARRVHGLHVRPLGRGDPLHRHRLGRDDARPRPGRRPRRGRDGLRVHGQLHPRQVGEPGLRARHRHGQRRPRPARDPDRHPHPRASSSPGCCPRPPTAARALPPT